MKKNTMKAIACMAASATMFGCAYINAEEQEKIVTAQTKEFKTASEVYGDNKATDMFEEIQATQISVIERTLAPVTITVAPVTDAPVQQEVKVEESYGSFDSSNRIFSDYSKEDRFILYRIVEAEAGGQGYDAKCNVAAVIFNRIKSDNFPDSPYEVVFEHHKGVYQFSPIFDGRYWKVSPTEETKKAVIDTYETGYDAFGAVFFANIADVRNLKTKKWFRSLTYLFGDESGHTFYK